MDALTAALDKLPTDVRELTEISKLNTENAGRLNDEFRWLAELITGLFQIHDKGIAPIVRTQ